MLQFKCANCTLIIGYSNFESHVESCTKLMFPQCPLHCGVDMAMTSMTKLQKHLYGVCPWFPLKCMTCGEIV